MPYSTHVVRRADPRDRPLVVHSHLRWDFVWQRPQQILSRLAQHAPVLFLEEPVFFDVAAPRLDLTMPTAGVHRAVPVLPSSMRDDQNGALATVRDLALEAIASGGPLAGTFDAPIQWFYTPMPAAAMLGAFGELGVVYDCMDELAQFRFAPTELPARERMLVDRADVVFTGGRRLYESKSRLHDNVHFFGCGVDAAHFGLARLDITELPHDVRELRRPIAGYFGVIDERLDYRLIGTLAERMPECSIVMVGPVVKVDPADLPRASNIHWLGQKRYEELPAYVKAFDVCLMPFALNEATEYINPTKTLEYMAAGRPIVSTAVADVITNFTPIVRVARSADEFATAVADAMTRPDDAMLARGLAMAHAATWESITSRMRQLIHEAVFPAARREEAMRRARGAWSAAPLDFDTSEAPRRYGAELGD